MDLDDHFKPKKPVGPSFGDNLAAFSIDDLEHRLGLIDAERARVLAEIEARKASRAAAESVFKL